jgi:hypothetical protein
MVCISPTVSPVICPFIRGTHCRSCDCLLLRRRLRSRFTAATDTGNIIGVRLLRPVGADSGGHTGRKQENEKWPQALSTLRFRAILTEARNDRMFSFLASGIKKHYDIGETLGK